MKKVLLLMLISLMTLFTVTACSSNQNPLVNKTFTNGIFIVGESDISAEFKDRVRYSFYQNTFIFELDYNTTNYSYFLGSYEYDDGSVTINVDKTVGALTNTTDNKIKVFKVLSFSFEDNQLVINTEIDGVTYNYTLK